MGFREIQTPHGKLTLVLCRHYTTEELIRLSRTTQLDAHGLPYGACIIFKDPQVSIAGQDLLMFELSNQLPPTYRQLPTEARESFMRTVMAPGVAANINRVLRDHREGKGTDLTPFYNALVSQPKPPDLAFVDVVVSPTDRMEQESNQLNAEGNRLGTGVQLGSAILAAAPWILWGRRLTPPGKKAKKKAKKRLEFKLSRRQFLKNAATSVAALSIGIPLGSALKTEGVIPEILTSQIARSGPIQGIREFMRRIVIMVHDTPNVSLRSALAALKAHALLDHLWQKKKKPLNAALYFGAGHCDLVDLLTNHSSRQSVLDQYSGRMHEYVDRELSENVIYLRYDQSLGEYVPEVIKLPGTVPK